MPANGILFLFHAAADRLVTLCMTSEEDGRSEESIGDACESDTASSPSAPDQAGSMPSTKRGSRNPPSLLSTSAASSPRAAPSVSLQLSSVILAAKSSFFRSLFTCGLKEACGANPVVLNVCPDGTACLAPSCANLLHGILRECREGWGGVVEVEPVVDLLRFIYTGKDFSEPPVVLPLVC